MKRVTPKFRRAQARHLRVPIADICEICGIHTQVQIFKGEGICSTLCKKERDDDHDPALGTLDSQGHLIKHKRKAKMIPSLKSTDFPLGS